MRNVRKLSGEVVGVNILDATFVAHCYMGFIENGQTVREGLEGSSRQFSSIQCVHYGLYLQLDVSFSGRHYQI